VHHPQGRIRIAPAGSAIVSSARSRDPRLSKMHPSFEVPQPSTSIASILPDMIRSSVLKLPKIPKYSNGAGKMRDHSDRHEREAIERRKREKDHHEESKEKSGKSGTSSGRKSSSSKESPRKKSDDDKKSSKNGSSHHKSSSSSSSSRRSNTKSPSSKVETAKSKEQDIDILFQSYDMDMRPDSTTNSKINKNKLLDHLLQNENLKSSQDMMISTSNNGKTNKIISLLMINARLFIMTCDISY
jgi:hypothetical protein